MSFFSRLKTRCRRRMAARATMAELNQLNERGLNDLGISRGDIPFIAKKNAKKQYPLPKK